MSSDAKRGQTLEPRGRGRARPRGRSEFFEAETEAEGKNGNTNVNKKRTDRIPDAHTPLFYNATVIVVIYRISTVIYTGEHCIVRIQV